MTRRAQRLRHGAGGLPKGDRGISGPKDALTGAVRMRLLPVRARVARVDERGAEKKAVAVAAHRGGGRAKQCWPGIIPKWQSCLIWRVPLEIAISTSCRC